MANFFPRWTNLLPLQIGAGVFFLGGAVSMGMWYYFTPKYTRVGYQPSQPIPFSHKIHVEQHGMDCRYCHNFVEKSPHSTVPTAETCMNCHRHVKKESPKLAPLREAWRTGQPIQWVKVHKAPDYVYFNHSVHINRGISCVNCHGQVPGMDTVYQAEPQSMSWCIDCHNDPGVAGNKGPEGALRPLNQVLNFHWKPDQEDREKFYRDLMTQNQKSAADLIQVIEKSENLKASGSGDFGQLLELSRKVYGNGPMTQKEVGLQLKAAWGVNPPTHCTGCHR